MDVEGELAAFATEDVQAPSEPATALPFSTMDASSFEGLVDRLWRGEGPFSFLRASLYSAYYFHLGDIFPNLDRHC